MATILVVDDEIGIRELLSEILSDEGHEIVLANNAAAARLVYNSQALDLVLLDIWMPDMDGMSLLREWTANQALFCPVIMMSGHASLDTAVEAQNLGAVGFLEKPITLHKLLSTVHKVLSKGVLKKNIVLNTYINPSLDTVNITNSTVPTANNVKVLTDAQVNTSTDFKSDGNIYKHIEKPEASQDKHSATAVEPLSIWHNALSKIPLDTGLRDFREAAERIYFNYVLHNEQGSMTRVAEIAGLERTHLYRKLKQLDIDLPRKSVKLNK
jgi:DNA-binding NtrC family response regulator